MFFEVLSRQEWIPHEHKLVIIRNAADLLAFHRDFLVALENPRQHQLYMDDQEEEDEEEQHIANTFLDMVRCEQPAFAIHIHTLFVLFLLAVPFFFHSPWSGPFISLFVLGPPRTYTLLN